MRQVGSLHETPEMGSEGQRARSSLTVGWRYVLGFAGLGRSDVILASFPRSGNTWIRFVLCNYLSLSELGGQEIDFPVLNATMPALGYSNLLSKWPYQSLPRFVKTHQSYRRLLYARPERVVYVQRDPRDVMVSYYHFLRFSGRRPYAKEFSDFIRDPHHGLRRCIHHCLSWRSKATVRLTYENLRGNTLRELSKMFRTLQIAVDDDILVRAVEQSSFGNIRAAEIRSRRQNSGRPDPDSLFARKGESGQWLEYFSPADLDYYEKICAVHQFSRYGDAAK